MGTALRIPDDYWWPAGESKRWTRCLTYIFFPVSRFTCCCMNTNQLVFEQDTVSPSSTQQHSIWHGLVEKQQWCGTANFPVTGMVHILKHILIYYFHGNEVCLSLPSHAIDLPLEHVLSLKIKHIHRWSLFCLQLNMTQHCQYVHFFLPRPITV